MIVTCYYIYGVCSQSIYIQIRYRVMYICGYVYYILFRYWGHLFRQNAVRYVVKGFVGLENIRVGGFVSDAACMCLAPCSCELELVVLFDLADDCDR